MKIVVEFKSWNCGDGCCSDWWLDFSLMEGGKVIDSAESRDFDFFPCGEGGEWSDEEKEAIRSFALALFDVESAEFDFVLN